MKLLKINIILILALIYLTPDFARLMNSSPFRGYYVSAQTGEVKENLSQKAKNTNFQRRRFLPLTKVIEAGKLFPALLPNPIYNHRNNDFAGYLYNPDEYDLLSTNSFSQNNKAPPTV